MPDEPADLRRERRLDFVTRWQKAMSAALSPERSRAEPCLEDDDVRDLRADDPRRMKIKEAIEAKIERVRADFRANPPQASTSLLVKLGLDPLGRGLGNRLSDDELP